MKSRMRRSEPRLQARQLLCIMAAIIHADPSRVGQWVNPQTGRKERNGRRSVEIAATLIQEVDLRLTGTDNSGSPDVKSGGEGAE
jgi:hypothetical protein